MKRLLMLPLLLAALGLGALSPWARTQPPDDFGVLKTSPAPAPASKPAPATLPAGVEPARPAAKAPPNPYPLPADAGAWLICAAAYSGPDGAELARQVCVILRQEHKLSAYIYNRGEEERKKQEEEWQRLKQATPNAPVRKRTVRIPDHYAVLVAGWPDFKAASDFLPKIKNLPGPELKLENGNPAYETMIYQELDPETKKMVPKRGRINPFHNAMVTRNPLAANTAPPRPKFDPFWIKLNEDEEYSLLKNKGKYTLLVKEYFGARELQSRTASSSSTPSFLSALGLGGSKVGAGLDGAAAQAHELARFLRDKSLGFKAFVLHTRQSSVVTVGEFNGPDDPELQRVQRQLSSLRFQGEKGGDDPIGLLPNPPPVEVPRPEARAGTH